MAVVGSGLKFGQIQTISLYYAVLISQHNIVAVVLDPRSDTSPDLKFYGSKPVAKRWPRKCLIPGVLFDDRWRLSTYDGARVLVDY